MENTRFQACRVWELIPVKVDNFAVWYSSPPVSPRGFIPLPPYEEKGGDDSCTYSHVTTEPDDGSLGTTVTEVTTVTTRKRYRLGSENQ